MVGKDAQIEQEAATSGVSCVGRAAEPRDWGLCPRRLRDGGSLPIDGEGLASPDALPHLHKYRAMSSLASRWVIRRTASTQWTGIRAGHAHQHVSIS